MNILFVTAVWVNKGESNIYSDLVQEFIKHGHSMTVATANEKRGDRQTCLSCEEGIEILRISTGSMQKTNKFKKTIYSFVYGIKLWYSTKKHMRKRYFDLIICSTPPVTISGAIKLIKRKYNAKMYLLLKDIWPQSAVDLHAMRKGGAVWTVFRFFEKLMYRNADFIGCMSPANINYLKKNNPYLDSGIIELCPNSMKLRNNKEICRDRIRKKYNLPLEAVIFIFGGNLGIPQGVGFLLELIGIMRDRKDVFFLIAGDGTETPKIKKYLAENKPECAAFISRLRKDDYDELVLSCDVGMILLNKLFTMPNFPSRLLSYLHAGLPVVAAVDEATDLGDILLQYGCGEKVPAGNIEAFVRAVDRLASNAALRTEMGKRARKLLETEYLVEKTYETIIRHFKREVSECV
ncbi:MAG: glycosyltransferase family 4 protein [Clostridia bacterium]|nr:glycosyltransferase family 4 protein [Clostridia bacterium]